MIGYFNPLDTTQDKGQTPFSTEQAMLEEWYNGRLTGILTSNPAPFKTKEFQCTQFVVAVSKKVTNGTLDGWICAASPEQRDVLSVMVQGQKPADLTLMTQQQYLADPNCVDLFVTAVQHPSPFLASLPFPWFCRDVAAGSQFKAEEYPLSYNVDPIMTTSLSLWLCS